MQKINLFFVYFQETRRGINYNRHRSGKLLRNSHVNDHAYLCTAVTITNGTSRVPDRWNVVIGMAADNLPVLTLR
ncbi:AAEL009552-PA [Aedes aegypti]|uniref:AAEL009552-PA n=1 Tax=Aedes aegypti TaxID=7159 RepID=Q16VI1_AEDAE|nr:AAEL009552-PA [Aedes aegypti]